MQDKYDYLALGIWGMNTVVKAGEPGVWNVESVGGGVVGAIEKQGETFTIVPSVTSPLGDLGPMPYVSLEAAMAGIGAHLQGSCQMDAGQ